MIKSLQDEIIARNEIVRSLSSIRDLAVIIQQAGNNVQQLKGSKVAIEIAKKLIPREMANINNQII